MADALTPRQLEVLRFIAAGTSFRTPPTYREICTHFGFTSTHAAHCHVAALAKKGVVEVRARTARAFLVTAAGWRLIGKQAA